MVVIYQYALGKGSDSRNRGIRSEDHEGIGSGREKLEVDHSIDDGEWQDEGWEVRKCY